MLRVVHIPGEATRYRVEGNTLECLGCGKLFSRLRRTELRIGAPCPSCGAGKLDVRFHLVDVAGYNLNGFCSCEFFSFSLGPKVANLLPAEQGEGKFRCSHIEAARGFALDVTIKAHEATRYKDARGQREEMAP